MYLIPCQGENKPILLKIGNQGVVFYSHGWLDPASAGGDECFKFMTSWGGGEGRVLLYRLLGGCFSVPFVPLENPEILKRAQKGEPGVLATERDPSVVHNVQQGEELQMSFFFFFNK